LRLGERQTEFYPPLASRDPPKGRVTQPDDPSGRVGLKGRKGVESNW